MIIVDTGGVLILRDARHPLSARARAVVEADAGPFLLSPLCLAEIDYMLAKHVGRHEQLDFLDEVAAGAYTLVTLRTEDVERGRELIARYADLGLSLADASIVLIADTYGTDRVLTNDERGFRTVLRGDGRPFVILPADA